MMRWIHIIFSTKIDNNFTAKLTKSGPLNRDGFVANAVAGAFVKHPPHKLFRHIHQGVLLLNADFAQRTTGYVGIVG